MVEPHLACKFHAISGTEYDIKNCKDCQKLFEKYKIKSSEEAEKWIKT